MKTNTHAKSKFASGEIADWYDAGNNKREKSSINGNPVLSGRWKANPMRSANKNTASQRTLMGLKDLNILTMIRISKAIIAEKLLKLKSGPVLHIALPCYRRSAPFRQGNLHQSVYHPLSICTGCQ